KNLKFEYVTNEKILKNLSFRIKKGETFAIVGPTGSGKTTIINLLLRFYDCPPRSIFIDGTDIRELDLKSLMPHLGYVSQDSFLFDDTIRNNLTYGLRREITEEELIRITKQAQLYDFILQQKDRFETKIGERGVMLSGGEKQRLSIARALLKGTQILILDEATSSLDSITEHQIQEAIDEAVKGRTAIVIAHRLSTIKNADKIVVIEDGRLIEQGTLDELLAKKGTFYKYWQEQKFD
ncbi:MAG: ATP-binding cassette domain-containing protein, partial [Candidatus Omnitrophota bacterium]